MKLGLITDTHYGIRNDDQVFYDYFKKSTDWFITEAQNRKFDAIVHLGDLYDRRKYVNFVTAHRARVDFLQPLNDLGIPIHILAGNHDEYFKNTHEINSLRELVGSRYQNIKIYSVPTLVDFGGTDVLLLPWITPENQAETLEMLDHAKKFTNIIFSHLDLKGFEELKGRISDHGMDPVLFQDFPIVYSGHFHHPSRIGNIRYLGAFTEHNWSDYNDPRGFSIFDTESRSLEFLQNPYHMFRMISYDDRDPAKQQVDPEGLANSYVKVVAASKNDLYAFETFLDALYKANPHDITVVEDVTNFIDTAEDTVDAAEDTPTLLSHYIDSLTLAVDSDKLKKLMLGIHTEALTMDFN